MFCICLENILTMPCHAKCFNKICSISFFLRQTQAEFYICGTSNVLHPLSLHRTTTAKGAKRYKLFRISFIFFSSSLIAFLLLSFWYLVFIDREKGKEREMAKKSCRKLRALAKKLPFCNTLSNFFLLREIFSSC